MRLRGKFFAASAPAFAVALVVIGCIVYTQLLKEHEKSIERDISLAAGSIDIRFESFSQEIESYVRLLASSTPVESWFDRSASQLNRSHIRRETESLFNRVLSNRPIIQNLRLLDRQGFEQMRVSDDSSSTTTPENQVSDWFPDVALSWWSISQRLIAQESPDKGPSLIFTAQVRNKDQGRSTTEILGFVVIDVLIKDIASNIGQSAVRSNGYTVFMDESLNLIDTPAPYFNDALMVRESLKRAQLNLNYDGNIATLEVDNTPRLVRQHLVTDGLVALVVFKASANQLFHHEIGTRVGIATLLAIIAFSTFFAFLVQKIVVTPIYQLQSNIKALSDGQPVPILQIHRSDEIGQLARAFFSMSEQLSDSMQRLQETSDRNAQLANHDGLTGLPNRRHFQATLEATVERAAQFNRQFAVLFIDLDNFKQLNDNYGHQAGDELLVTTANRLTESLDSIVGAHKHQSCTLDYHVARLAGDEFVVVLFGFESEPFIRKAATELVNHLCQPTRVDGESWLLAASVGVALYPQHASDAESLLACADQAMYAAKRVPHSGWRLFDSDGPIPLPRAS